MIGALISLLSLDMTERLIAAGLIASTLTVTDASNTTPIVLETEDPHGFARPYHGVVSGVGGNTAANGSWRLVPTDATHLQLVRYDQQGFLFNSVGTASYTTGGIIQIAFPEGGILLGRRNVPMHMAVATPRIVFVPVDSPAWELQPYGGIVNAPGLPHTLSAMTAEQRTMLLARQENTERLRFEVHVTGCATPADPDFGDFDVTQALYHTLHACMFDMLTPPCFRVLGGRWTSQDATMQQVDVRGQKWTGIVEVWMPVINAPLSFVPVGVVGELDVNFQGGASADTVVITLPGAAP